MRFLQRLMSLPGRRLVLVLLLFAAGSAAQAQNYRIAFGPDSSSTDPEGCTAAGAKWYPTAAAACQGATTALPLCDRNTATYRGYVAQLTSPTLCYVQWEFLNNGTTSWSSWSGTYGITVERAIDIYRDCKQSPKCPMKAGNPIYPLTGGKQEFVETGLAIGGQSLKLTYSSTRATAASAAGRSAKDFGDLPAFGALWLSSLHRRLLIADSGFGAKLFRGDGTVVQFLRQGGVFVADGDVTGQLTSVSGAYRYVDADSQSIETYNSSGQLIGLVDTVGNALTYSYSMGATGTAPAAGYLMQVTDHAGRSVRFEYALPSGGSADSDGRVSRIIDATGQVIAAGYDLNGNLMSLTWMDGKVRQFLYENQTFSWALTGVVDENNSRYATFTYDDVGRAISTGYVGGVNQFTVSYGTPPAVVITEVHDTANNILYRYHDWQAPSGTTLLTPAGQNVELNATSILGAAVLTSMSQPAGSGCSASSGGLAYDANGNVSSRDDFQGNRTCYAYDSSNRETVRVEGLANTVDCTTVTSAEATLPAGARRISTTWHPDWRKPAKVMPPRSATSFVYHGQQDPFNNNATANCTPAANLPNGKSLPLVCRQVVQATLDTGGYSYQEDPWYNKVTLLLHADGTNGSKSFVDSSGNPKTATVSGNAAISTVHGKFGGASAYFDGASSSYISFPSASTIVGAGDLTIEGWIYPTATTQGTIYNNWTGSGSNHSLLYVVNSQLQWYYSGDSNFASPANSVPVNQWTHFALVRSGTTCAIYINGVSVASTTCSSAIGTTATDLRLGNATWNNIPLKGYLDDVRVTVGQARYTANFTPSTSPLGWSNIDASVPSQVTSYTYDTAGRVLTAKDALNRTTSYNYYSDTVFPGNPPDSYDPDYDLVTLLLHGNGGNGATTIVDSGGAPKTVTAIGNAQISTAQSVFGGSSMFFDGTGDSLSVAASNDFDLGSSDFTVEFWYYPVAISAGNGILGTWDTTAGQYSWLVAHPNPAQLGAPPKERIRFVASADGNYNGNTRDFYGTGAGSAITLNAWQHIAVVRASGVFRLFLNGTLLTTTAIGSQPSSGTFTVFNNNKPFKLGAFDSTANGGANGYIDDLRLTKGRARYTANFTPPTQEFPNQARPVPSPTTDVGHTMGDLQSITNPAGHVTQFTQYDRAGRVRQMIDPKGVVTDITYTPRGWVSTVTTTAPGGAGRTTSHTYDGVGQLTGVIQPDGSTLSYSYDAAHRLVGVTDAKGNSVNYTLDNVGNRIAEEIKDPSGNLQRSIARSFDALNRLQQVTGAAR